MKMVAVIGENMVLIRRSMAGDKGSRVCSRERKGGSELEMKQLTQSTGPEITLTSRGASDA